MTAHLTGLAAALSAVVLLAAPSRAPMRAGIAGGRPDTLVADVRTSRVEWNGIRPLGNEPARGSARLTSGVLVIRHEMLEQATFTVATHPVATFTSRSAERMGPARWRVDGELAMSGTTRPLSLDADVSWTGVGHMLATTRFTLDSSAVSVTVHALRKAPGVASRSFLSRLLD